MYKKGKGGEERKESREVKQNVREKREGGKEHSIPDINHCERQERQQLPVTY